MFEIRGIYQCACALLHADAMGIPAIASHRFKTGGWPLGKNEQLYRRYKASLRFS